MLKLSLVWLGIALVLPGLALAAPLAQEDFESMPTWDSSHDANWGGAATWTIVAGGQSGNALQGVQPNGSSAKVLWWDVPTNTDIEISVYMKCPTGSGQAYWMETGYKFGQNTGENFNEGSGWTLIKKFDAAAWVNEYPDGNNNTWTQYSSGVINTGTNTQISIGVKAGSSGGGPTMQWDTLVMTPEPGALALLALSAMPLILRRRRA